jgi:hypothetical protein
MALIQRAQLGVFAEDRRLEIVPAQTADAAPAAERVGIE